MLQGGGPDDVVSLTLALAREMLAGAGHGDVDPVEHLRDGSAYDVWRRMVLAQHGDPRGPRSPRAAETHVVSAPATGTLTRLDAYAVGVAAWRLGGRPRSQGGPGLRPPAGVTLVGHGRRAGHRGPSRCSPCTPTSPPGSSRALAALDGAIGVDTSDTPLPLVLERVTRLRRIVQINRPETPDIPPDF